MHHVRERTSITKAARVWKAARTVEKPPSPFSTFEGVRLAIMETIFRLGRQDQKPLKKIGTLMRRSHLYLIKAINHDHLKKEKTKDNLNFSQLWSMEELFLTSITKKPGMRT